MNDEKTKIPCLFFNKLCICRSCVMQIKVVLLSMFDDSYIAILKNFKAEYKILPDLMFFN